MGVRTMGDHIWGKYGHSGPVDIIRTVYYIHGAELMKLIFAVSYVSRTMGLTRCYKTEVFFTFIILKTHETTRSTKAV